MLGSDQKLRHNKDFIRVFKQGKRHSSGGVLLSYAKKFNNETKVGFVVSKKYSPLAVKRNKQRRILQAVTQKLYPTLKPGFDIVICYTNHNKVLPYKDALVILKELFNKSHLIK